MIENSVIIERIIQEFSTPVHIYFPRQVAKSAEEFKQVAAKHYKNSRICFAVKSNPCGGAVRVAKNLGLGVDVVSEFELFAAINAGFSGDAIVCNGNAKTDSYIRLAVDHQATIAADSFEEVLLIAEYARESQTHARVMIRLSGMALEGYTSADQSTAAHWTKFGIHYSEWREFYKLAGSLPWVSPIGISAHIGTQICDEVGYERLLTELIEIVELAHKEGHKIHKIDFGGGYPLSYLDESEWQRFRNRLKSQRQGAPTSEWMSWGEFGMGGSGDNWSGKAYWSKYPGASMFEHLLKYRPDKGKSISERLKAVGSPEILLEPGRALFGEAGLTLAEVTGVKEVEGNHVVVLDLGIVNHGTVLVTPDIYPMFVYPQRAEDQPIEAFVAGRLCFTGDMISKVKIPLNRMPKRGEIMVIGMTGAYCADHFASNSCGFPRPPKVAILDDGSFEIWRHPESVDEVFGL